LLPGDSSCAACGQTRPTREKANDTTEYRNFSPDDEERNDNLHDATDEKACLGPNDLRLKGGTLTPPTPPAGPKKTRKPRPTRKAEHPEHEPEETQCQSCCGTLLPADNAGAACGKDRTPNEKANDANALKNFDPGDEETLKAQEEAEEAAAEATPTTRAEPDHKNPKADTDKRGSPSAADVLENQEETAEEPLPWHGGTFAPPPKQDRNNQTAEAAPDDAGQPLDPKPKRLSGYMAWVRQNRAAIAEAAGKAGGLKAFGAEAGKRWKGLTQDERDAYKALARPTAEDGLTREEPQQPHGLGGEQSTLRSTDAEDFLRRERPPEHDATLERAKPETPKDTTGPEAPLLETLTPAQRRMASVLARVRAREQEQRGHGDPRS